MNDDPRVSVTIREALEQLRHNAARSAKSSEAFPLMCEDCQRLGHVRAALLKRLELLFERRRPLPSGLIVLQGLDA